MDSLDLPLFRRIPAKKIATVRSMIERRINTVETSACGRLFDAVASIVGVRDEVNFEAQAAIELEACALRRTWTRAIRSKSRRQSVADRRAADDRTASSRDVLAAKPTGWISAAFHNTVAAIVVEVCLRLRQPKESIACA